MPEPEKADSGVGAGIRRARLAADMKATELARAVGVTRTTVHNWESGLTTPSDDRVAQVAEVLGVSIGEIFPVGAPAGLSAAGISPSERTELPPGVAKAARRLVDAFKREMALGGATSEELHYIETVLMTPNLPPTLAGGQVAPDRLLEHIQGLMDPIRSLLRDAGRRV